MNSKLNTILFGLLVIIMLGVGVWLGYNAYNQKLETEASGEELFFLQPNDENYSIKWYSETYLVDAKVTPTENEVQIVNSGGELLYSFNKSLYAGDESEFNKTCDALRIEKGPDVNDQVRIYGINCV